MLMLSPHFSLEELTATQHRGIDNTPSPQVIENLKLLAGDLLELVRMLLGPVHINSGYRSPELNAMVGGQPTSQHCEGLAADFIVTRFTLQEATRRIRGQHIIFDQLIYEFGGWIHISHPPVGRLGRGEALMVGGWTDGKYLPLDLAKVPR
jgi:hypothetical protein